MFLRRASHHYLSICLPIAMDRVAETSELPGSTPMATAMRGHWPRGAEKSCQSQCERKSEHMGWDRCSGQSGLWGLPDRGGEEDRRVPAAGHTLAPLLTAKGPWASVSAFLCLSFSDTKDCGRPPHDGVARMNVPLRTTPLHFFSAVLQPHLYPLPPTGPTPWDHIPLQS